MRKRLRLFAEAYRRTGEVGLSAFEAGYPARQAGEIGKKLLKNRHVIKWLAENPPEPKPKPKKKRKSRAKKKVVPVVIEVEPEVEPVSEAGNDEETCENAGLSSQKPI